MSKHMTASPSAKEMDVSGEDLSYVVRGTLRHRDSGAPLAQLVVRAFDRDFFRDQFLGNGVTDANGRYEIRFTRNEFTGPVLRLERHPDLFIVVFDPEGQLVHSARDSVVVDARRETTIDLAIAYEGTVSAPATTPLFGIEVNAPRLAALTSRDILDAWRLMRNPHLKLPRAKQIREALPSLFRGRSHERAECGNGIHELFRYLMKERQALGDFDDADADPFGGAAVRQFFTANIVVKYTTAATLPDGSANPNALPAGSAAVPTADINYTMPSGTVIGTVRASLADLDPANTEVAPTYIQKIGLLAELALSRYIAAPFAYRDPRGGLARLEFRVLSLGAGVAGYAVPTDFHMELNTANADSQNLGTVPHELFHLVQFRYNAGGTAAGGIRGSMMEGGARLIEESINETPNRYVESAADGDVTTGVVRRGIFQFPEETLLDLGGTQSLLRYAAGLMWKYIAEQHSTRTGAPDEPAIGVDSYRRIIEQMVPTADGFTVAAVRNGRAALPWYGSFDQFAYYDAAATELNSHETTWANFLLANYFHRLWTPAAAGFDRRFDYMEDDDLPGNVAKLNTFSPVIAENFTVAAGSSATKVVTGHKPFAARYYELTPNAASPPRMVRVGFSASAGLSDPVVQIVRIGAGNTLVDIHRSDRTAYSKTINMTGLTKVLVVVASRENSGDFTLHVDEVASASDVMVTRWNTAAGTEYEVDPAGWSWTWISPDIMVDTDDDLLDDTAVFFGRDNKLKVRLRNRGNTAASNIQVAFWYQKATPFLSSAAWIPVQDSGGTTQQLSGLMLPAGTDNWFSVNWAPLDDGTHHPHWCVKVAVSCPGDPNSDNKVAFRNFADVAVANPDTSFDAMIRHHLWTTRDKLVVVPRGPRHTLQWRNQAEFGRGEPSGHECSCGARLIAGVPDDLRFAKFSVMPAPTKPWDGRHHGPPETTEMHYPVHPSTLPPGVGAAEIVTVAHAQGSRPLGGISYRVR
jgi:hypothetical protein